MVVKADMDKLTNTIYNSLLNNWYVKKECK